MKNEEIKHPITNELRYFNEKISQLTDLLNKLSKPRPFWFEKVPTKDLLQIIDLIASSRASLWSEVYRLYPELAGKTLQYTEKEIKILN
jgi:hypothetical protein